MVKISDCPDGTTVPPTTVTATKLVVKPPNCAASATPKDITVTKGTGQTSTLKGQLTFLAKPAIEPGPRQPPP